MNKALLLLFLFCLKFSSFAQDLGSQGVFVRPNVATANTKGIMNFNPALDFSKGKTLFAYPNVLNKSYTLFYVYKAIKLQDLGSKGELPFIEMHYNGRVYNATSTFFAGDTKFYIDTDPRFYGTIVNHYGSFTPSKVQDKMRANFLFLFNRPNVELYEVVVFPMMLSSVDYATIYSYLSIKYSIPLPPGFDYVDYEGKVIWDAKENSTYNSRMIGLGREDKLGLRQYQSMAYKDSVLIAGFADAVQPYSHQVQIKELADNSYVLLGDNDKPLNFEKKKGQEQLERKWKIVNRKVKTDLHLFFAQKEIEQREKENEQAALEYAYYASVSAKDNGSLATLIPMEVKHDSLLYCVIPMNTDQKYVSLIRKPKVDFNFGYQITCDAIYVDVNVLHGKGPFTVKIKTEATVKTLTSTTTSFHFDLPQTEETNFEFTLEDALGNRKTKAIDFLDALVPPVSIEPIYYLTQQGNVEVNPSLNGSTTENISYQWYDHKRNLISTEPTLILKEVGSYTLEIQNDSHEYCSNFTVQAVTSGKEIHKVGLYPNPVNKLEEFVVYIPLDHKQDAEVLVYTNKGQLLDYRRYIKANQILYKSNIATTGMYIIVVKTGEQKQFYRLMVK